MRTLVLRFVALIILALSAGQALADDWKVTRLRGQVMQLVDGDWQKLDRGTVVPDDRVLRTLASGRASLVRGNENIELGPNTQIRIFDEGGPKPFTTVQQQFGTVTIEAEVRDVQHFAVQTPFLAAVVKGTRFTVTSGKYGAAVKVQRGHVRVDDRADRTTTTVSAGQQAKVAVGAVMTVSGKGELPPVVGPGTGLSNAMQATPRTDRANEALDAALASGDAKAIEKARKDLAKATADAARDAAKAAEDAAKDAEKAAKEQAKAAQKAAEDAAKAAEKAAKDAEKAAKDAAKDDNSGKGSSGKGKSGKG